MLTHTTRSASAERIRERYSKLTHRDGRITTQGSLVHLQGYREAAVSRVFKLAVCLNSEKVILMLGEHVWVLIAPLFPFQRPFTPTQVFPVLADYTSVQVESGWSFAEYVTQRHLIPESMF